MIKFLVELLVQLCIKTNNVHYITGGKNKDVYLARYIVFKSKYLCIYIHRFLRSDADTPHDHPWNFFTYVVSGKYKEVFYDRSVQSTRGNKFTALARKHINLRPAGSLAYRKATDIHQVVVDKTRTLKEIQDAPLTICVMGPRVREWGFLG